jgi:hypothetical protein
MKSSHCITSCAFKCLAAAFVLSFCEATYGSTPTSDYGHLTSSSTNLLYGSISSGSICDCFSSIVGVVFIYSYSWTWFIYGSLSSYIVSMVP